MDELGRPSRGASLSPDGAAVAYLVEVEGYPQAVQRWRTEDELSEPRWVRLPVDGPVTRVAHSPDSRWLACQVAPGGGERNQVWLVTTDPADSSAWRIDDGLDPAGLPPTPADACLVGWDGGRIAISVQTHDGSGEGRLIDPVSRAVEIVDKRPGGMLLDAQGRARLVRSGPRSHRRLHLLCGGDEIDLLPGDPGSTSEQGFLLDERRVLVRSDHEAEYARLLLVEITDDGPRHRVLAERADAELEDFEVSLDHGHAVLLWNVAGGHSEVQLLELSGLTTDDPGWRLREPIELPTPMAGEPSITADGSVVALTLQGPGRVPVVHLFHPAAEHWLAIEPVLHQTQTLHPRWLRFTASDGLELNGWWYQAPVTPADVERRDGGETVDPADPAGSGPGPVALWFHGGPEGQSRPEWSYHIPSLLAAGVSVFAPNVRGSGGQGRAYLHADEVERRWRGIADVVDVVDFLITQGYARADRIAITGRSYGGYLVNAALAFHPELFAVGVSICGMSDLLTFYRDTEVWIAKAAHSKYGHPRHDRELLAGLSPMRAVDQIRAPLLCLHGSTDTNVPVTESLQLVEALTELGGEASCVVIADEGHEFSRPLNRLRAAGLLTEWVSRGLGVRN